MSSQPQKVVLRLSHLNKSFAKIDANSDISLELHQGEVLALLGENGAGKTTLMNMLFGHYLPDSGTIEVADPQGELRQLELGKPRAAIAAGVGMVHQHFTLAHNLSALDNIVLGSEPLLRLRHSRGRRRKLTALIRRTGLSVALDKHVANLTVGERQRVEIIKALYRDARILVLDEPTAVLTPQEADKLYSNLRKLAQDGMAIIFISHKLREVLAFSDRIVVLRRGRKVAELPSSSASAPDLAQLMVGTAAARPQLAQQRVGGKNSIRLALHQVSAHGSLRQDSLHDVNLTLHDHQIVGIAGVSGNGQQLLAEIISGLRPWQRGQISLDGKPFPVANPAALLKLGVARIPEDRQQHGIVASMSLAENLILERLNATDFQKCGWLQRQAIQANAISSCKKYDIRGAGIDTATRLLSGGNMQKLILARIFANKPKLVLAAQPTRGLDVNAAAVVAERLLAIRNAGAAILLISDDLDEIISLSDRIMVMHAGRLRPAPANDRAAIGLLMAGKSPTRLTNQTAAA